MITRTSSSLEVGLRLLLAFTLLLSSASPPSNTTQAAAPGRERLGPVGRPGGSFADWPEPLGPRPSPSSFSPDFNKGSRTARWAENGPLSPAGQSGTLLPDGRWLLIGGEGPEGPLAAAAVRDATSGAVTLLANELHHARAWHTATLLPDGTVLVLGGIGANGKLADIAELFNPETQEFETLPPTGLSPRAYHTTTLLTERRVLVVGGLSATGETLGTIELWDPRTRSIVAPPAELLTPRRKHTATLLPDGAVLFWGGTDRNDAELSFGEVYDPATQRFRVETVKPQPSADPPRLEASLPEDRAENVPLDTLIALRFSKPLRVQTVNATTVNLNSPQGALAAKVVPAEGGMLAFVTPASPLLPGTTYSTLLSGPEDAASVRLVDTMLTFTTAGAPGSTGGLLTDQTGTTGSAGQQLPPLQAATGVTALAGQVLTLNGNALPNVTLQAGGITTHTDSTGRFLLAPLTSGHQVLFIDGRSASVPGTTYGTFEVGVDVLAGRTNVLSFTIWMPVLDMAHATTIPSPTSTQVVITTPVLPNLELRIPPQTVIRDHEGRPVTQISITPIPLNRPPFPLPAGVSVPIYFTIQPGGAYIQNPDHIGARLIYPNLRNAPPGTRFNFWNYDANLRGWYVYGQGTVSADGRQIVPDPGVVIYEFTGAMVADPNLAPPNGPPPGDSCAPDGDPVDCSTGLFVLTKTDLFLPDVLPINLTRTYRPNDNPSVTRAFGIGTTHPYDIFLVGDTSKFIDVVLADGGRIHYPRISGSSLQDSVFQHTSSPTAFYGSTINWNGNGWNLNLKDGTLYTFRDGFNAGRPQQAALVGIRDRYGNTLRVARDSNYNVTQITSPNGRWISFTYDTSNRIKTATDNIGRTVSYQYDTCGSGMLCQVTDANQPPGVTQYTYDFTTTPPTRRMLTVKDARGTTHVKNEYDDNGRVKKQMLADTGVYLFDYSVASTTTVTDPRGNKRTITFNPNGYTTASTRFDQQGVQQQKITLDRDSTTNLVNSVNVVTPADPPAGFTTSYTYDLALGNLNSVTTFDNTPAAAKTTYEYEPVFNQVATITDPLQHKTTFVYWADGSLKEVRDALTPPNITTFMNNTAGQPISITDPLQKQTQLSYDNGDLASITDPLTRTTTFFTDAAGRLLRVTNPLNQTTRYQYDPFDRITQITDPVAGVTKLEYDPNENLLTVTDAVQNQMPQPKKTVYTYESMNRLQTRTDQLGNVERYDYDLAGNLQHFTDRRGKVANFGYDALNRRTSAGFGTRDCTPSTCESTIAYSYDGLDRLTQATDSLGANVTRTYDDPNRTLTETTPQGSITYVFDAAGRRQQMTVGGQAAVYYTFDEANRLKQITQGTGASAPTVKFGYDNDSRRQTLTLPNGIVMTYGYDNASQLTGITYKKPDMTALGDLTYGYDAAGRRTSMDGTLAATNLPQTVTSTVYNDANQLTNWGGATLTYDLNGNLADDGTNTYQWDARNQLATINNGATASFEYDALGRRTSKTIGAATTSFLYDDANVVQELSGSPPANLLTGLGVDEVFTRTDASGTANFLADALGSTLALTDSTATIQTQYTYEPFGNTTASGQASANPYQYTGRENDGTGLYYYRARYYNPATGRFISEDPIRFGGGIDLYAYAADSPINLADPSGLCPPTKCQPPNTHNPKPRSACSIYPDFYHRFACRRLGGDNAIDNCVRGCLLDQYDTSKHTYKCDERELHCSCFDACGYRGGIARTIGRQHFDCDEKAAPPIPM